MAAISETLAIAIRHHQAGRLQDAERLYREILQAQPNQLDATFFLGMIAHQTGRLEMAAEYIGRAIRLKGDVAVFHSNLGNVLRNQGKLDEAAACHRRALELKPDYVDAYNNLGVVLKNQGKLDQAAACYRRALELAPNFAGAHSNLGNVLMEQGKLDEAAACHRRALELKPDFAEAHNNLGKVLMEKGNPDEAAACCRRALELKPGYAEAHNNLGIALMDQVKLDQAAACHRRALEIKPDFVAAHDSLIVLLHLCPDQNDRTIYEENRRWNQMHAEPLAKFILPHHNDRSADRRLRIGYVSPDFREHCESFFTVPLFSSHDHEKFEIFCYSDVAVPDDITARLRNCADTWRNIRGMTDEQVASMVRQDRIDILVDLNMHRTRNRLLAFARKPAPVQVCWLSYPGTTGLSTMDYRLTDDCLDPPGSDGSCYSEESIHLPGPSWCYDPLTGEPAVNALPAGDKGCVTFGDLNAFVKISDTALRLWAKVLMAVDRSRLMLLTPKDAGRHRHILGLLEQEGVALDRVTFVDRRPRRQYLELYHQIDICLDTFPYNGHTTSLDSFWMGVPVITMVGRTVVGREGLNLLMNLGLPDLVARTPEEFVTIAVNLAYDLKRLGKLRSTLRKCMQNSVIMDAPRFARNIEAAYRQMWRKWCDK